VSKKKKVRIPHVYTIIFSLVVITALASLVVPGGVYDRNDTGQVVPDSFRFDDAEVENGGPAGWSLFFAIFTTPLRGFGAVADIIVFILVVGGAFKVIEKTGAFTTLIRFTVTRLGGRESLLFIASMLLFSAGGAIFGMSEEIIPFILIFVPLARALGYDPLVGVAIPLIGAGVGFAGAMINPFTVGVAQAIAGLQPQSGWRYRTLIWVLLTAIGIAYVLLRARKWRVAAVTPEEDRLEGEARLSVSQLVVLGGLAAGIVLILYGVAKYEWYVIEIGAVFLGVGIFSGLVSRISGSDIARAFIAGARDLVSAAMVVGLARGIVLLAQDARILDTALYGMSSVIGSVPEIVSINLMFMFQSLLNFLVPSGSGQAALTMPIMAPLADLIGLSRQSAVLAYQFGDGFSNMIIPTAPVLMGSLEVGKVPYERWFKFAWPLQLLLIAVGVILLSIAVLTGYS